MNKLMARLHRWEWIPLTVVFAYFAYTVYDAFVPVVWMRGAVVSQAPDSVVVGITGWKLRMCRFHGIQAYSVDGEGRRHSADIRRVDRPEKKTTHPIGKYDIGQWDIRPLTGGYGVLVYAHHACYVDDLRMTKLVEVPL